MNSTQLIGISALGQQADLQYSHLGHLTTVRAQRLAIESHILARMLHCSSGVTESGEALTLFCSCSYFLYSWIKPVQAMKALTASRL